MPPTWPTASPEATAAELARDFPERAEQVRVILAKAGQPRYEVAIRYAVSTSRDPAMAAQPHRGDLAA